MKIPSEPPASTPGLTLGSLTSLSSSNLRAWRGGQYLEDLEEKLNAWDGANRPNFQTPPPEWWSTWLVLGGRGSGKTWAGAQWLSERAEYGGRFALVGATLHDVREVMIEGPSGLRAQAPPGLSVSYEVSRRRLRWSNGAVAYAFSAEDSDSLRGPQFHAAWADEFCAWPDPAETLAQLRLGLRLGEWPAMMVTTTPKPIPALRTLMAELPTCTMRVPTAQNAHRLSPTFLDGLRLLYGGTRLEAQELEGQLVEAFEGALWRAEDFARCRGEAPRFEKGARFDRVVIGVDPPAGTTGAACGIVAVGRVGDHAHVLGDFSVRGLSPGGWADRVARAAATHEADAVVAEANQGGEMVRSVLTSSALPCPVKLVHARLGKRARAEPVAALYERGRVTHCGAFPLLEEELMSLGADGAPSPDRADALVWAVTELLLTPREGAPRVRVL